MNHDMSNTPEPANQSINTEKPVSTPPKAKEFQPNWLKVIYIAIFAYFGVLTRVLLGELSKYLPFFDTLGRGYFLPNILGSFAMGVFCEIDP